MLQHHEGKTSTGAVPRVVASGREIHELVLCARCAGHIVGVVPTMGALHEGHLSLVDASRAECDLTVVTIFVNPTQFGPAEDFERYPRDLEADVRLAGQRGADLVFAPTVEEMYPPGHAVTVDPGAAGEMLEGKFRPGHFRGMATIVLKLFQLVPAHRAYFGRKDYQQALVVRQIVEDLNVPIEMRVRPTVREPDGLAMSSRNAYLSGQQRKQAVALWQALRLAKELHRRGQRDVATIRRQMIQQIDQSGGLELQYIAFVADGTLTPVEHIDGPTTVAVAAKVGGTRLIDNVLIQ